MAQRRKQNLDLATVFQAVSDKMVENRTSLNQADDYNHDHGDHMVEIFEVINEAVGSKRGKKPAEQLAYASELLEQRSQSGSAKIYADGLRQASQQFKGRSITPDNISTLLGSLFGGQSTGQGASTAAPDSLESLMGAAAGDQGTGSSAPMDLLASLLGGAGGGQQAGAQPSSAPGDLLASLLGGAGGNQPASSQQGLDLGDLLNAGMAFMNSQQQGESSLESIAKAFVAATQVGKQPHRAQSGEIIANTIFNLLDKQSSR